MYKKDCNIIVHIIFMLLASIPTVYGMNTGRYKHEDLKSGDFTPFVDDMVQRIIEYLYTSLPDDCKVEYFKDPLFKKMLHSVCRTNQKGLIPLGVTCKRFWFFSKECVDKNKERLSNLIFQLLRPSKHSKFTAVNIGSCITAGADINYRNEWNETPLIYAISTPPCHKFIDGLIKEGAWVNQVGALEKAQYYNDRYGDRYDYRNIIKLLIEHGAQLTHIDIYDSDDNFLSSSSESDSVSESFFAYSTSGDDSFDAPASDGALQLSGSDLASGHVLISGDDGSFHLSSEEDSISGSFFAYSTSSDDSLSTAENNNIHPLQLPIIDPMPVIASVSDNILNLDDEPSSSSESVASEDTSIHKPQPSIPDPTIPGPAPTLGGTPPNNPDDGTFTAVLRGIRANPLLTLVGATAVGGVCYWAYNKYKAYKAAQAPEEQGEQIENDETADILP